MSDDDAHAFEHLLELHLGQLDDERRTWLEAELLRDPSLRALSDRLGKLLRPLDHWQVAPTADNLPERVLAFVRGAADQARPTIPFSEEVIYRRAPFGSIRQVIAIAACLVALVSVAGPGLSQVRARSHRAACASNLGSIFRGMTLYQQAFGGSLPFAGNVAGAAWLPGSAPDLPYQSNSRHIYLIAKLNYGPLPQNFICPADRSAKPMRADELDSYDDFAAACNISYDSMNLAGDCPNVRPRRIMAFMSDRNPLFVNARFNGMIDPTRTNSPAHGGKDQRVLILDGSVTRLTVPVYGPQKDNLWLAGSIRRYVGTETPSCNDDAFLIPGYPITDPVVLRGAAK